MAEPWEAEHAINEALARELVRGVRPDLGEVPLSLVGRGWDVDVWRAGDLAFRFPRRALGVECVQNEIDVLPRLAGRFPMPIPVPICIGRPTPRYPYPFYGHAYLAGTTADRAAPSDADRLKLAAPLGALLKAIHAVSAAEGLALGAKPDKLRRDMAAVASRVLARLPLLERSAHAAWVPRIREAMSRVPPNAPDEDRLIHADLYARHLLLADSHDELVGVIDWGDVCVGDPAVDLGIAFVFLHGAARDAFFTAYGRPVDAVTRDRARFIGLARHAIAVLAYAVDIGDRKLEAEALRGLEFALE